MKATLPGAMRAYVRPRETFTPAYVETYESGALRDKVEMALDELRSCRVCPRNCDVDRLADEKAVCRTGRHALVASAFPHFGEEDCLRGFWDPTQAKRLVLADDYPETACAAIREMHRQVGDLVFDEDGLALRGVLVRHLVMPGGTAGTREILRFLAREVSPEVYVNVMDQYSPQHQVTKRPDQYADIDRRVSSEEMREAVQIASEEGARLDERWQRLVRIA